MLFDAHLNTAHGFLNGANNSMLVIHYLHSLYTRQAATKCFIDFGIAHVKQSPRCKKAKITKPIAGYIWVIA